MDNIKPVNHHQRHVVNTTFPRAPHAGLRLASTRTQQQRAQTAASLSRKRYRNEGAGAQRKFERRGTMLPEANAAGSEEALAAETAAEVRDGTFRDFRR